MRIEHLVIQGSSTPAVTTCRAARTTRAQQWYSPTLSYILLNEGDESQKYNKILRDGRSSK